MNCASSFVYINSNKINAGKLYQQVDSNVISVKFDSLKETEKNIFLGDPVFCKSCMATLSNISKVLLFDEYSLYINSSNAKNILQNENLPIITKENIKETSTYTVPDKIENLNSDHEKEEEKESIVSPSYKNIQKKSSLPLDFASLSKDDKIWICEFCSEHNKVSIEPQEIPSSADVIYMLQSIDQLKKNNPLSDNSDLTNIFCLDNSGSMGVTSQINHQIDLNYGITEEERKMLEQFIEEGDEDQFFPNQNQNISWVSRKQCVVAAIENELQQLAKLNPNRKVGLVTFNNEVLVFGDGHGEPTVITGDKLWKHDLCMNIGFGNYEKLMSIPIGKSLEKIMKKLKELQQNGQTALGPALLVSLALASKGKPGSSVILCTDGLANQGLGEMETIEGEEASKTFYNNLGEFAKNHGIVVNIITIKGEECNLESLGKVCDLTNGKVTRVNPENIAQDFSNILKDEIVATKVEIKIRLHEALTFRNEKLEFLTNNNSFYKKFLGNVNSKTEVTFEFENRSDKELKALGLDINKIDLVPFQAQIIYTSTNGSSLMRVITKQQKTTHKLEEAEENLNMRLLATRQVQMSSELAQQGELIKAQKINKKWDSYISNNMQKNLDKDQKFSKELLIYQEKSRKLNKAIGRKANNKLKKGEKLRKSSIGKNSSGSDSAEEDLHSNIRCLSREASADELETDLQNMKQAYSDEYSE